MVTAFRDHCAPPNVSIVAARRCSGLPAVIVFGSSSRCTQFVYAFNGKDAHKHAKDAKSGRMACARKPEKCQRQTLHPSGPRLARSGWPVARLFILRDTNLQAVAIQSERRSFRWPFPSMDGKGFGISDRKKKILRLLDCTSLPPDERRRLVELPDLPKYTSVAVTVAWKRRRRCKQRFKSPLCRSASVRMFERHSSFERHRRTRLAVTFCPNALTRRGRGCELCTDLKTISFRRHLHMNGS